MRPKKAQQIATITEAPGEVERGYVAKWLVVCTLPHRDPKRGSYTRKNGDSSLSIQTGLDADGNEIGLPYGALVRLLLFWIISEANRTKSRTLNLGDSINAFLRLVGLDPKTGNGKRGDMKRLREQMNRLFQCRISFKRTESGEQRKGISWLNMDVAPKGELWWDVHSPEQATLFESYIVLGEEFYNAVTENPAPFDFRALCALKHSPMAIDLYAWLTWRVFAMTKAGETQAAIPLNGADGIAQQFGSNYTRADHFKAALSEGLEAVKQVWPQLDYDLSATRLTIRKSPVPITEVDPLKKRRAFGQVKADELDIDTRIWFQKAHPRIKFPTVWKAYRTFLEREQIKPTSIDKHFKDYAAKWVKGEL